MVRINNTWTSHETLVAVGYFWEKRVSELTHLYTSKPACCSQSSVIMRQLFLTILQTQMFDFRAKALGMKGTYRNLKPHKLTPGTMAVKPAGMICRNQYFQPKVGEVKCFEL